MIKNEIIFHKFVTILNNNITSAFYTKFIELLECKIVQRKLRRLILPRLYS